jgi:exopolyphosphatase/guanosine-5'-triphosphate,3'-diphosphate pyrophosphatase
MPAASRSADADDDDVFAALDIGTNSFHLVVARLSDGQVEVVAREEATVRLGHDGGDMRVLAPAAIERGLAALVRMRQVADAHAAPIRAVATSAVREARNAADFVARAATEAGLDVEVLSGLEEARLIHLGVLQAVPVPDHRVLVVDIGGGSTEVILGERGELLQARSFGLGAVHLTDRFFPDGLVVPASVAACRAAVRAVLATFAGDVRATGFDVALASSGTGETVARMVSARRGDPPASTYNCFGFSAAEVDDVVDALVAHRTTERRRTLPGLDPTRADIGVAGALVLQAVADTYAVERFVFSEGALREGVLLDEIARRR